MITTNAISVALAIIIQTILTVKGGDAPTVTCRGVIFEPEAQATDSPPVWPLDTCINMEDMSLVYQCDGSNGVQVASWNATGCNEGNGYTDWYEDIDSTVASDGCQLTNPCGIAVIDEWLNPTSSCAINDTQMHLSDISVALDQCWYDIKQQSYVSLSCTAKDDPSIGFGFDLTWTKYADSTGCTGDRQVETIDGTGSRCIDGMPFSPYFENIQCIFPTKVFETECRSVSENNGPVWPLDECIGSASWDSDTSQYKKHSWQYFCEQSAPGESWVIHESKWDNTMTCEGDPTESGVPTNINADGCNRGQICSFVNLDEYLYSKDGQGACVKNEQGDNNNHVNVSIVTDVCINQNGNYFKLSCSNSDGTTFDKLTYTAYTDDDCSTVDTIEEIDGEAGCLDIDFAPYFANIECKKTSPVYETECRSVSPNNNVNWAIDECISTSTYDDQGVIQESSSMYKCDENEDLYEVKYESSDCSITGNEEYDYLAIGINAHGCTRSKPCDLINFDEYLNSKGADGLQTCSKNVDGENNFHVVAGLVEGVCFVNNHGEYVKLSCEKELLEDSNVDFGYTMTYETFPDANCEGTAVAQTISEESCLDIPEAPYFNSMTCYFVATAYDTPTSCKAVWENYNTIWPIDKCLTFDNPNELQSKQYVCDSNNGLMVKEYDNANDCAGTPTRSVRAEDIARYDCESLVECPMATIEEYLNSEKNGVCEKNDADPTADDYMFIKVDVVLNTCWQSHHGDYIKVRCQTDESSDFGVKLIYENYTDSVGCVADMANNIPIVDIINSPDCLDIPETAFISALTCTGAEADSSDPAMQPTEMPLPGAGGANSIKNNSIFVWITMGLVAYWMLN